MFRCCLGPVLMQHIPLCCSNHKNIPKSLGHHPKWRISGSRKSGCLEVLICLYESISLCAAGFDATLSRKNPRPTHHLHLCHFCLQHHVIHGFSSRNIMKYHEMPPLCLSPIRFSIFSSKRPFDLASTPAPASRSICITLVLPFDEACHSGVRPRRNK